jgi:hypothetical protein
LRAEIAQGGMETASVVDFVDEPRKMPADIGEGFLGHRIDGFDLEGLHKTLGLGVVVRIASASHRTDETAAKQGFPISLSGVLRTAIRMVDAAGRRLTALDGDIERGERQSDVDRAADRVADRPAGPGVEDHRDIGKTVSDSDIGYVRDPELIGPFDRQVFGSIGIDRLVMIAVGRGHIAATPARLKIVFAHQSSDLLVIDGHPSMAQLGAHASPAVRFELVANRGAIASTIAVSSCAASGCS